MVVPGLCAFCHKPTSMACHLCGRPVCNAHRSPGGLVVCMDCARGRRGGIERGG